MKIAVLKITKGGIFNIKENIKEVIRFYIHNTSGVK